MSWVLRTHAMDVISCHRVGWSFKGIRASSCSFAFHSISHPTGRKDSQDTRYLTTPAYDTCPPSNNQPHEQTYPTQRNATQPNATQPNPNPNPNPTSVTANPFRIRWLLRCCVRCSMHTCVLRAAASVRAALLHCWTGRVATVTD